MWLSAKWLVLWSLWAARVVRQPTEPLRVSNGWLRGIISPSGSHAAYVGIPYATVTHRFQAPGPEPVWDGIFDAVEENVRCSQALQIEYPLLTGQENCLTLNVYTPLNTMPGDLLPVMFYIHGGGFFEGSASSAIYGPDYLIGKGVILVTINYRLNAQGFLCLGIKEAPGNAGMKDQVAALKWVQRNIKLFNGDPDNVTIFGESAGSTSVSFHLLSPMSKGLFHKAIMQSGSSLTGWTLQQDPIHTAVRKAKLWGFNSTDPHDLYKFFNSLNDFDLAYRIVPREEGTLKLYQVIFVPCMEKHFDGVEPFLTEMPYDILSQGKINKVPTIIGSNSEEGLFFVGIENDYHIDRVDIDKILPKNLEFPTIDERREVVNEVRELYFGDSKIAVDTVHNLSKYVGEAFFNHPAIVERDLIMQHSDKPVYSYLMNYGGWRNIIKFLGHKELRGVSGTGHADDIFYIFSQYHIPTLFENEMIDKMTTMWTNFAKYGDPTPSPNKLLPLRWPQSSRETKDHTLIIEQNFSIGSPLSKQSLNFWNKVYSKYRRKYTSYCKVNLCGVLVIILIGYVIYMTSIYLTQA